jgi:5'-nucleotidase
MADGALDLSRARILVTNDDGIHAPGLQVLERIARSISSDVWVVAPETEQSATSHSLTLRRPLRCRQQAERHYAVDGTPTDCVVVAHRHVMADCPPDLVFSGINHGSNLGEDVTYSGTVAAAMEAAILGVRAFAFSQMRQGDEPLSWDTAERYAPDIVRQAVSIEWPRDMLINVNFPAVAPDAVQGVRACRQGRRDEGTTIAEGTDPAGRPYLWIGNFMSDVGSESDTDLAVVMENAIAVTPLHLDLTHAQSLSNLAKVFR